VVEEESAQVSALTAAGLLDIACDLLGIVCK
jgi:hypothetical protein